MNEDEVKDRNVLIEKGSSFLIKPSGEIKVTIYAKVGSNIREHEIELQLQKI